MQYKTKEIMKKSNDNSGRFVVEFLLKTEKWHEHRIDKMMNILTDQYQQKQRFLLAKYNEYLANTADGKALTDAIEEAKAISKDESVSEEDKKSAWNKVNSARKAFHEYLKTIESSLFTKFAIKGLFDGHSKTITYKNNKVYNGINSEMLRYLGECAWKSWDKKINTYNKDIHIHIDKKDKKFKKVNIIKSSYSKGQITGISYSLDEHSITLRDVKSKSQNNNGTPITLSFIVNDKSIYEKEAFKNEVRNIAIVRRQIRGKNKYYVQFTFAGKPYNKVNIGSGTGAIDPSLKKMTFLSMDKGICQIMNLAPSVTEDVKMINKLQRKLDCIRRADNPDNYNPDGTIKKYNSDGTKLVWNESAIYIMYKNKLADMKRKYAAKRKIDHNKLANELISELVFCQQIMMSNTSDAKIHYYSVLVFCQQIMMSNTTYFISCILSNVCISTMCFVIRCLMNTFFFQNTHFL